MAQPHSIRVCRRWLGADGSIYTKQDLPRKLIEDRIGFGNIVPIFVFKYIVAVGRPEVREARDN